MVHQKLLWGSIFLFAFLAFSTSKAQIVNIESKRLAKDTTGLFGSIDLSVGFTQNTRQIWQGQNRIKLQYQSKKNAYLLLNDIGLMQVDGKQFLNKGFQHFRFNRRLDEKFLGLEAFAQTQYNSVQLINLRALIGAGLRAKLHQSDSLSSFMGILVMREYEELRNDFGTNRDTRLSGYLSLNWIINDIVKYNTINYYQPKLDGFGDFRISHESTLIITVSKHLAIKIIYEHLYDSQPPTGIPESIYHLRNALSYAF